MDLVECFDPETSRCRIESVCALRDALDEALDAFLAAERVAPEADPAASGAEPPA
jgi:hypothetical protein